MFCFWTLHGFESMLMSKLICSFWGKIIEIFWIVTKTHTMEIPSYMEDSAAFVRCGFGFQGFWIFEDKERLPTLTPNMRCHPKYRRISLESLKRSVVKWWICGIGESTVVGSVYSWCGFGKAGTWPAFPSMIANY